MAIKKSGLAAFEDFLRARWSMYQQVYFHRTSTACEAVVSYVFKNITQLTLPVDLDDYLKIDDWSFIDFASDIIIKSNNKNKEFIKKTLVELIKERKIWKIIYEENLEKHSGSRSQSVSKLIVAELERKKIPCSHVESSKSLTKFSPLRNNKENQNTFMVLSQSSYSQLKLTPIENESKLICKLEDEIIIRRIFASPTTAEGDRVPLDELRAHIDSMVSY